MGDAVEVVQVGAVETRRMGVVGFGKKDQEELAMVEGVADWYAEDHDTEHVGNETKLAETEQVTWEATTYHWPGWESRSK